MDLSDSPEQAAFRQEARKWLAQNVPQGIAERGFSLPTDKQTLELLRDWQRRLYEAGFLGIRGRRNMAARARRWSTARFSTKRWRGCARRRRSTARSFDGGADDPRARHRGAEAPLRAEDSLVRGNLVPGFFGARLRARTSPRCKTRAVLEGDDFVVNGAEGLDLASRHLADWCMLLVRTDPDAPKHRGHLAICWSTCTAPASRVRPLRQMTGEENSTRCFSRTCACRAKICSARSTADGASR